MRVLRRARVIRALIKILEITLRILLTLYLLRLKRLLKSSSLDKRMLLSYLGSPSLLRVQVQETFEEIDESFYRSELALFHLITVLFLFSDESFFQLVQRIQIYLREFLGFWNHFSSCLDVLFSCFHSPRLSLVVVEEVRVSFPCCLGSHNVIGHVAHNFNDSSYLIPFWISRKERDSNK